MGRHHLLYRGSVCNVGGTLTRSLEEVLLDLDRQTIVNHLHRRVSGLGQAHPLSLGAALSGALVVAAGQLDVGCREALVDFGDKLDLAFVVFGHYRHPVHCRVGAALAGRIEILGQLGLVAVGLVDVEPTDSRLVSLHLVLAGLVALLEGSAGSGRRRPNSTT